MFDASWGSFRVIQKVKKSKILFQNITYPNEKSKLVGTSDPTCTTVALPLSLYIVIRYWLLNHLLLYLAGVSTWDPYVLDVWILDAQIMQIKKQLVHQLQLDNPMCFVVEKD